MLEGLDRVDWQSLHHAYGPATDVPAWIRSIATEAKRGKAFTSFVNAVNHQGTATPAALPSVPFLLELVTAGAGPVAELIVLLGDLAAAGDHANVLGFGTEVIDAHSDGAALFAAVQGAGLDVFRRLTKDVNPRVRAATAVPLAMLGDADGKTAKALEAAIEAESKAEPLASSLLALAWLARQRGDASAVTLLDAHAKNKAAAVRTAAAVGASWLEPSPARTRALAAAVKKAPVAAAVPFAHGDLRGLAVTEIAARSIHDGDVDGFLDLNDELELMEERELYEAVLAAIVPELAKPPVEAPLASDFSESQRRVLARLAERVIASSNEGYVALDAFHDRGIIAPVRLFGGAEQGPLDDVVDGEPLWRHARRARDGRSDIAAFCAIVERWAGSDTGKREALAKDCFANGHTLSMPYPYVYGEVYAKQWKKDAAWGAVLGATLDGLPSKLLGQLATGTTRAAAYAVAPWVRALAGELDAAAAKKVDHILRSEQLEPSVGRAVLEALPARTREDLAKRCSFDVLIASEERPPRVYLRGAWQWLDLSPALTLKMCEEVASWTEVPEAKSAPHMEEAIVEEVASTLRRAPNVLAAATPLLARAQPAGRRVLAQMLALRS